MAKDSIKLKRQRSFDMFLLNDSSEQLAPIDSADILAKQPLEKQQAYFKLWVEEEVSQQLKYNALRALLVQELTPPVKLNKLAIDELVKKALNLSQILLTKYDLYINEHASFLTKSALQSHIDSYTHYLNNTIPFTAPDVKKTWFELTQEWLFAEFTTERMNPRRLYVLRERRFLVLLAPFIKDFAHYSSWILWADGYVLPCLTYLNTAFFLPRLIFNLMTLFDNVFYENKMKSEAKKLDSWTRFKAQWSRLWPQIMNDVAWVLGGIAMCMCLCASFSPFSIYVSVFMQFYDVVIASVRLGIDLNRLHKLTEQYNKNLIFDDNNEPDELYVSYYRHLEASIRREKSLLILALINAAFICLAICLSLPFMVAIYPAFPVIGAAIAIAMTIINFQTRSALNTPVNLNVEELLKQRVLDASSSPSSPSTPEESSSHRTTPTSFFSPRSKSPLNQYPVTPHSPSLRTRSQSYHDIKTVNSPSPSSVVSRSMDDMDAYYMMGVKPLS